MNRVALLPIVQYHEQSHTSLTDLFLWCIWVTHCWRNCLYFFGCFDLLQQRGFALAKSSRCCIATRPGMDEKKIRHREIPSFGHQITDIFKLSFVIFSLLNKRTYLPCVLSSGASKGPKRPCHLPPHGDLSTQSCILQGSFHNCRISVSCILVDDEGIGFQMAAHKRYELALVCLVWKGISPCLDVLPWIRRGEHLRMFCFVVFRARDLQLKYNYLSLTSWCKFIRIVHVNMLI